MLPSKIHAAFDSRSAEMVELLLKLLGAGGWDTLWLSLWDAEAVRIRAETGEWAAPPPPPQPEPEPEPASDSDTPAFDLDLVFGQDDDGSDGSDGGADGGAAVEAVPDAGGDAPSFGASIKAEEAAARTEAVGVPAASVQAAAAPPAPLESGAEVLRDGAAPTAAFASRLTIVLITSNS